MTSGTLHVRKPERRDRLIQEHVHDPYQARAKPHEPTVCPQCGAVFTRGRWQWTGAPATGAHEEMCPACRRIQDKVPAGLLALKGEFFRAHRDEILRLVHNKVEEQRIEHALKRMMSIEERPDGVELAFTDTHLPRGVGEAIERAFEGQLEIQYTDESNLVRVQWTR